MRLARDQQHPQFVAHPVDGDHGAIIDQRQFVLERRGLDLDDVRAGVLDLDLDIDGLAARHRALVDHFAVAAHHDLCAFAADALVVEPVGDGLGLPDDAEPGGGGNRNAAVALVLASGDQGMHRGLKSKRRGVGGNVMHPPIGDQEGAGDAIDRNIRQRRRQRTEQFGAIGLAVGLAGLDHPHLQPLDLLEAFDQCFLRLRGFPGALAEVLARALVDHDRGHRRQRLTLLAGK